MSLSPVLLDGLTLAAVALVVLVAISLYRHRGPPVANALVGSVLAMAGWAAFLLLPGTFGIPSGQSVPGWTVVELCRLLTGGAVPILVYVYARLYTGHNQYREPRTVVTLFAPLALAIVLIGLFPLVEGIVPESALGVVPLVAISLYVYLTGVVLLGLYLLRRLSQRYRQVSSVQIAILAISVFAPYVSVFASSLTEPTESGGTISLLPVDVSFVGFVVSGLAFLVVVRSYPVFTPVPGAEYIARDEVIENLAAGVLILDREDRIIDMNETAAGICTGSTEAVIGQPIWEVFDELSRVPAESVRRIDLATPDGPRQFEVTTTPIQSGEDGPVGKTVRLRDITQQQTREQQLKVLTRVLRHNLRNDVDTALAYSNEIDDPEVRGQIRSSLDDLVQIGEKARDIEEVLATADDARSELDLSERVRSAASRIESAHSNSTVTVSVPDRLTIVGNRQLLDRLLVELVENGIEHNDSTSPQVDVTVDNTGSAVRIEIADNGPGIPKHERAVIESGVETPLEHSTGLGLWLARWIADALGGDLQFPETDSGGTVVVRLHRAGKTLDLQRDEADSVDTTTDHEPAQPTPRTE